MKLETLPPPAEHAHAESGSRAAFAQRPNFIPPEAARALIDAYRVHGHRVATIDPIGAWPGDVAATDELDPASHGIVAPATAFCEVEIGGERSILPLDELVATLRATYCGTLALDTSHLRSRDHRRWLHAEMERRRAQSPATGGAALHLIGLLVAAEAFEQFVRTAYPGQKQFSAEGCESLIPLLDAVLEAAASAGTDDVVLGMAHRGRLNAMVNALGATATQILSLFTSRPDPTLAAWDLKDHVGCTVRKRTASGEVTVLLAHNPSHLGSVAPVVCGMARALQDRRPDAARTGVLPVLVHGDAAFAGQGVVAETLNLAQTRGYGVGGTLHVIANNQVGSTIYDRRDARSTLHAADLARGFETPIFHVNADDPEAVVDAARIATRYRSRFGADAVIDLVGFRRIGHFGGDDPAMTQPAMQRRIRAHRGVAARYAGVLADRGVVDAAAFDCMRTEATARFEAARSEAEARAAAAATEPLDAAPSSQRAAVITAVPAVELVSMIARLAVRPAGFEPHPAVEERRKRWESIAAAGDGEVDWCTAETLAYASLLRNGFNVRLTGLDVGRGTFFHRDAVWHDQSADRDGERVHVPLRHLGEASGHFAIFESPLSEEAVLGFEYGYSLCGKRDLVVWEAQFGDFVNAAQTIIDQFIASGERKWRFESGLVMLLPHGIEGGGPEHSSGYLGRFLQLCGDDNLRVVMPSTAAQFHHLLRRQALADRRRPLVVMTPKMALRTQRGSFARLSELATAAFEPVIGDRPADPARVTRAVIASGKLVHDLVDARAAASRHDVAVVRLEELYPFPAEALARELARYPRLASAVFAQEEPRNHGAWHLVREDIECVLPAGVTLAYAGRPAAAPSGGCDPVQHAAEQRALVASALG